MNEYEGTTAEEGLAVAWHKHIEAGLRKQIKVMDEIIVNQRETIDRLACEVYDAREASVVKYSTAREKLKACFKILTDK